jgi:hypothetical protein
MDYSRDTALQYLPHAGRLHQFGENILLYSTAADEFTQVSDR